MSERKVLNKYYPPDFDPTKIPRSKVARNKTFVIRLMAPCNMRCTTCGEYIYKGRKFNARKEDVDDMNHLGLRIYRFYIRCTACVSEIAFRTDPANTDYILEAGATRNFEALSKAEKQAEAVQKAHEQDLVDNPMKMLEERTEASKNELDKMEALEELQELNKRMVKVDYDTMLDKYDRLREAEARRAEDEDEAFVKSIFSKDGGSGETVKRIVEDDGEDGDSSDEEYRRTKKIKVEKATDFLGGGDGGAKKEKKKEAWEISVGGTLSATKKGLGVLVKKKGMSAAVATVEKSVETAKKPEEASTSGASLSTAGSSGSQPKPLPAASALSLLGNYSDSSESD
jgi:hypothetical protein